MVINHLLMNPFLELRDMNLLETTHRFQWRSCLLGLDEVQYLSFHGGSQVIWNPATPEMLFNPKTPDPSYGNTIPSYGNTPGALKQVVLTSHDIPWSLREQRVYPWKNGGWKADKQATFAAFPIQSKGNFSGGEVFKLREGILEKISPTLPHPFQLAQVYTGAWTRVLDLGGRIGEKGGGNIGEGGIGAWQAIYWKHFLKVSSWMVSVSLLRIGEKTQVGQFDFTKLPAYLFRRKCWEITNFPLKN